MLLLPGCAVVCRFVVDLLRARFVHDPEKICCRFVLVLLSLCCRFVVDLFRARVAGVDHSADGETEAAWQLKKKQTKSNNQTQITNKNKTQTKSKTK